MTKMWYRIRDLWIDSVWFRVCTATVLIGSCIVARALLAANTYQRTQSDMQDTVQQLQGVLGDGTTNLTDEQEALIRQGVQSLTPDQRKQYDEIMERFDQP